VNRKALDWGKLKPYGSRDTNATVGESQTGRYTPAIKLTEFAGVENACADTREWRPGALELRRSRGDGQATRYQPVPQ